MLDVLDSEQIEFAGSVTINLYEINPFFDKFYQSYNVVIESKMDGTNWYAEYENSETNLPIGLYYKNHEGKACEIGLSFMNDEQYYPMLDDDKNEISWSDAGLYNSLRNLKVSDFIFNEETWAYEYNNLNMDLVNKIIDSANPYDLNLLVFL